MLEDRALEHNRRVAWAKFFAARRDLRQLAWWAVELAEWVDALGDDLPDSVMQTMKMVRLALPAADLAIVERYVRGQIATVAA